MKKIVIIIFQIIIFNNLYGQNYYNNKVDEDRVFDIYGCNNNCYESTLEKLNELYENIKIGKFNIDLLLNNFYTIGFATSATGAAFTASIYNFEIFDDVVILFFSKTYYDYIIGKNDFINIACCYSFNPMLLLFYQHFLKISKYNPTSGWFISDIYKWAITQERFWNNEDIKSEFEKIQKINNLKEEK